MFKTKQFEYLLKFVNIIVFLLITCTFIYGQNIDNFKNKYGDSKYVFDIKPGLMMIVKTLANGKIDEIIIIKKHYNISYIESNFMFDDKLALELIDEILPVDQRMDKNINYGLMSITGSVKITFYNYKNVDISFFQSTIPSKNDEPLLFFKMKNNKE